MGVGSYQPLAKSKGVDREVNLKEADGKVPNRGTRTTLGKADSEEFAKRNEVLYPESQRVNVAVTWDEGYASYHGRSHGRVDVFFRSMDNNCREKLAKP